MIKKYIYLLLLSFYAGIPFAQNQTEIAGIAYSFYPTSKSNDNTMQSNVQDLTVFANYGNKLNKKTTLFYHADFHKINYNSLTNNSLLLPNYVNHSLWTFGVGMKNTLPKNWKLTNIFTTTFLDDFNNSHLKLSNYFRTFSFVTKQKSATFNYGFGVYLSTVSTKLNIYPIISVMYKTESRGIKLFFPRYIKFWQKTTKNSFIELKSNFLTKRLEYNKNPKNKLKIISLTTALTYNYLFYEKYKFNIGIAIPYNKNTYYNLDYKSSQFGKIGVRVGVSYVLSAVK